jgi:hypothetical protein
MGSNVVRGSIKEAVMESRENCITFHAGTLIMPHSGMKLDP